MNGKNLSPEALEMVAGRFKIFSEPLRLQLLQTMQDGEKSVTELTAAVQTSQPNVVMCRTGRRSGEAQRKLKAL
jgi:rhodanese-related sulfurtransferase